MRKLRLWRPLAAALTILAALCVMAPAAFAEEEPLWVFIPKPPPDGFGSGFLPPPLGKLNGPCGATVDSTGRFYISDYYHDNIDAWEHEGGKLFTGLNFEGIPTYQHVQYYYEPENRPP